MKRIAAALCSTLLLLSGCSEPMNLSFGDDIRLDDGWTLQREGDKTVYNAIVPSTVAGALLDAGYFQADLLESDNYAKADKSIFDDAWVYTREFGLAVADGQRYELCFDGLSYYADIIFNGRTLASSDTTKGVFIGRSYDVTDLVKANNKVEVRLKRAQPRDLNIGFVDWNPRPLDESMGIVRPVHLHVSGAVSIEDVFVKPHLDLEGFETADLEVMVTLRNNESAPVAGKIRFELEDESCSEVAFALEGGQTSEIVLTPAEAGCLHIDNPRVWWSWDLGTPELYGLNVSCLVDDAVSDVKDVTFGVKEISSRITKEGYRQFTLNGKDILVKGAGWADDIFLRDTEESLERQVRYVKDMNMNCIRFENIWGKDDTIYDLCDKYGLLAMVGWSCQWEWKEYCGIQEKEPYGCIDTPELIALATAYFHDQVIRLHNHASIIAWLTGSDGIPAPALEENYMELFNKYGNCPYVCSAKNLTSTVTGPSGTKMAGPYEYVGPEYWYSPEAEGGAFGFNTETCAGSSIPQAGSIKKMIPEDSLWPISDKWYYHCTASTSAMNTTAVLEDVVNGYYGEADSFEDFVMKAHAVDYNGVRAMFEAFRANIPASTGIIQWMLNSAWPSMYWQLYDWYGVPTAGYYGVKKACEPLQLIFNYKDRKVYAVNDSAESRKLVAAVKVYNADSEQIGSETSVIDVEYRSPLAVFNLAKYDGKEHFVALTLVTTNGEIVSDNFYCLPAKDNVHDWDNSEWYVTPISEYADMKFAFAGEEKDVTMSVADTDGGKAVTLVNNGQKIVYMNVLTAVDGNGEIVVPAFWSDNFFPLEPGQTKTVICKVEGDVTIEMANK